MASQYFLIIFRDEFNHLEDVKLGSSHHLLCHSLACLMFNTCKQTVSIMKLRLGHPVHIHKFYPLLKFYSYYKRMFPQHFDIPTIDRLLIIHSIICRILNLKTQRRATKKCLYFSDFGKLILIWNTFYLVKHINQSVQSIRKVCNVFVATSLKKKKKWKTINTNHRPLLRYIWWFWIYKLPTLDSRLVEQNRLHKKIFSFIISAYLIY